MGKLRDEESALRNQLIHCTKQILPTNRIRDRIVSSVRLVLGAASCLPHGMACLERRIPIALQADQFSEGNHNAICGKLRTSSNTAACSKINGQSDAKI